MVSSGLQVVEGVKQQLGYIHTSPARICNFSGSGNGLDATVAPLCFRRQAKKSTPVKLPFVLNLQVAVRMVKAAAVRLEQKSPAEFFAENKNIAGFDNVCHSDLHWCRPLPHDD